MRSHAAMKFSSVTVGMILFAAATAALAARQDPHARRFVFDYQAAIKQLPAGAGSVDVWLPVPQSEADQAISSVRIEAPVPIDLTPEAEFGNEIMHLRFASPPAAPVTIGLEVTATRRENSGHRETLSPEMRR